MPSLYLDIELLADRAYRAPCHSPDVLLHPFHCRFINTYSISQGLPGHAATDPLSPDAAASAASLPPRVVAQIGDQEGVESDR